MRGKQRKQERASGARGTGGLALLLAGVAVAPAAASASLPLVPYPAEVHAASGVLRVAEGARIVVPAEDQAARNAAQVLAAHAISARGLKLSIAEGNSAGGAVAVRFVRDPAITGPEAYRLEVTPAGATIAASQPSGFLYGAMTFNQLLGTASGSVAQVPALTIVDAPRFAWRGLMVDTARHFQPLASLRTLVDQMVEVKLNVLHLHLTDDQGWRFEVKRYPRLTETGAWRRSPGAGQGESGRVGGFYTQDELKGLVAYAKARGITIVPEIDLPGHAQALLAAYPELGVIGAAPKVSHDWGINPYLFNPGPEGMAFVKAVLDEVMEVFPSTYIHLGGDEAVKDQWERSPQVQAQMRALGITSENALQSWMIEQLGQYLGEHGRRLIGWDEILEGGIPPSASVMSWRGEDGAIAAANAGHDVVLSPSPGLYLDNKQSTLGDEPAGRGFVQSLEAIYRYDPMPAAIAPDKAGHVMGVQANAWSEYLVTPWQMQHKIFPRAGALAEDGWSPRASGKKDYAAFLARLDPQIRRWKKAGVEVADSAFAVDFALARPLGETLDARRVGVTLVTQAPYGTIRYTLDGSEPDPRSKAYAAPLNVVPGTVIRAASFAADGAVLSAVRRFDTAHTALMTAPNAALTGCGADALWLRLPLGADATAKGPAYNTNIFDACSAQEKAPLGHARSVTVTVVRLPRNFGLAHDIWTEVRHYPTSPHGELVVSAACKAAAKAAEGDPKARHHDPLPGASLLATWPLPDPATAPQRFDVHAVLPEVAMKDESDVCFQFTAPLSDPLYAVESVTWSDAAK
ncbi:family 20 glycosylhydrolase [Novosphingobium profundi]|uniref:beta-N-acetylhexosaminidase n=1 Tax=Novosphingobium profundi TaxID=1774954 RepID=UPI001BDA351A|nr:family 20 glycosylhydrolase [Novosphingobium profundi]MBT0667953.1 family 20 glycosylhydrolase [Novosphingobium profundi]